MASKLPQGSRRDRWTWYLYDFGNSAYAAVVLLAVYAAYFKGVVVANGAEGSRLWGIALAIAMIVVALTSPILGTIADHSGQKKNFLLFFTLMAVIFCASLFFVKGGDIFIGMLFFILAEIGYRGAQVFYNSLLPEVADKENIDRVSGIGWAVGSIGGVICLLIVLVPISLIKGELVIRASLLFTAVYFLAFTIPLFVWLKEKSEPRRIPDGENFFTLAFKRLKKTLSTAGKFNEFVKFIVAFLLFNDGILMALNFAAIFGAVIFGLEQQQLIIFMIIVQITSAAGAFIMGSVSNRLGVKNGLIISLILMIITVVIIFFNNSLTGFFILGGMAGFALTGVQSLSRTMVGVLAPPKQSAEFYGFFAVAGRTSSFIGPAVYGFIAAGLATYYTKLGNTAIVAEQLGQRWAILSINIFLILGLGLLLFVHEKNIKAEELELEGD